MAEGEMCAPTCDAKRKEKVVGYWTCKRGLLRGDPTCTDKEGKYWLVSWVLPKIVGGFQFKGDLMRGKNVTNETIGSFQKNTTDALISILQIRLRDYSKFELHHVSTETKADGSYKVKYRNYHLAAEFLTLWNIYEFKYNYEILIWDKNTLTHNFNALKNLIVKDSSEQKLFYDEMLRISNCHIEKDMLLPTIAPMIFNETFIAPDTEQTSDARWLQRVNPCFWALFYWLASRSLTQRHHSDCANSR